MPAARTARLFFALWPDDAVGASLYQFAQILHKDCGGRLTRRDNLHQTLVFLGSVADYRIPELTGLAANLRVPAFNLEFGVTGYWRHNRLVWAAPRATPEPLRVLVTALEQGLRQEGLRFDPRSYVSHVTLIRNARMPTALPQLAFDWPVDDFVLVESARDARGSAYRVLARWPLDPG